MKIKDILAAKSLADLPGEAREGNSRSVQFKAIDLDRSETYSDCIAVSYNGGPIQVLEQPSEKSQFLARGM